MDITVPSKSLRRWEELLSLRRPAPHSSSRRKRRRRCSSPPTRTRSTDDAGNIDPFDCSDVAVPPIHEMVEQQVKRAAVRWKDLDSRRVVPDVPAAMPVPASGIAQKGRKAKEKKVRIASEATVFPAATGGASTTSTGMSKVALRLRSGKAKKRITDNRVRLPQSFDVGCSSDAPPSVPSPDDPSYQSRDKVVSLADTTKLLDYETELHKLFSSVPTEDEIEEEATNGSVCTNMLALKAEVEEGLKDYTRLDGHALGRMRLRERHSLPSRIWSAAATAGHDRGVSTSSSTEDCSSSSSSAIEKCQGVAIRIECWRRMAKRGSTPDCHRLELELWGGETLEDLHKILLELGREAAGVVTLADGSGSFDGRTRLFTDSGMFFIEDTFYTCGEVDYAAPVIDWLDGRQAGNHNDDTEAKEDNKGKDDDDADEEKVFATDYPIHALRKNYLGLSPSVALPQRRTPVPMSTVRLDSLPFRMGQRYLHACDGNREIALFFTDVRVVLEGEDITCYPLVHDTWSCSSSRPDCAGCEQRPAVMMTYQNELTSGAPTPLCESCFRMLHYGPDGKLQPGAGGDNMKVLPLAMVMGWDDSWASNEKVDSIF